MKIKKCCGKLDNTTCYLHNDLTRELSELDNGKIYIWAIPPNCWEEEGSYKEIFYCPFCGKKIEVVE